MNTLGEDFQYYEFVLDSLDSTQAGNSSSSSLDWPVFQIGGRKPLENIAGIKVLEVQIPFSWYVISSGHNVLTLLETGHTGVEVTLTPGNYNVTQLGDLVATAFTAASQVSSTYTAVVDTNTQKITFYNGQASSSPFSVNVAEDGPWLALGFSIGSNDGTGFLATGTNKGNYNVLPNVYSVTGPNYLFVNSNSLGPMMNLYLPEGAGGGGNSGPQVAKIPVTVLPGGTIFWSDPDPNFWFSLENLNSLTRADFFLTLGNTSDVVKLNGLSFSLKLGILESASQTSEVEGYVKRMKRK
jgi:hypothetical protein